LHNLAHGAAIVVSGHADNNVHFANADQFANKIIRKYASFGQKLLLTPTVVKRTRSRPHGRDARASTIYFRLFLA